ncbi:MAG TPA: molybdopterin-dependent oxidoreductase [Candidatus Binatia bacterium]|jgi:formate dehydrogenase
MKETRHTFCRICEALCGLEVDVEEGRVTAIRPDAEHVATSGFACAKGLKQHRMYDSPDRLMYPTKRVGTSWQRISWEQANYEIGQKVRAISEDTGPDSIAMYVGTAAGFGVLHPAFAQGFMTGLGSRSMYSSATQDCANKFAVARQVYGFPFTQPFPDLDRTDCLVITGANPAISKWSFLQVSNPIKRLRDMEERGAKIFIVDPRRTETAKVAGEHVFIRPGTDVFFFLAFLRELIATGGVDRARVAAHMRGFDDLEKIAEPWTPQRTAEVTQIPAEKLQEMVTCYRKAAGAAMYCSTGVNMGGNGSLAFWIQECINAVSGNLDRSGGTLVGMGVTDFIAFGKKTGTLLSNHESRVGGFRSTNDAFPGGILADEILTPGRGQVRALFVTGGNPLLTMANSARLRDSFAKLELLVTLDIFRSETGQLAHYNLPCTSPLQRPDLPFIFPLMLGLQSKPYLQATDRVVDPEGEQRDEATIYLDLARASGVSLFGSRPVQASLEFARSLNSLRSKDAQPSVPQKALLSAILRATRQGGFRKLLREKHGRPRPDHQAGTFLGKRVITEDQRVDLAPPALVAQAAKLESDFASERENASKLKLITRRAVTTHNSWTHNLEEFVDADRVTNYLYMHPDDAGRAGLTEGALADVTTDTATVRVPVRLLPELMPGTVALPHGWGHQAATGLSVASKTRGVNVNLLSPDGPGRIEKISGMAHLTGFVVDVRPASGPLEHDWSGVAAS